MDAAKLSRKDEAMVRTTAGGLHDELKVVNAFLELADQLEGKQGYPIGRGEPEMPDEDEYLVQKKYRDRDNTGNFKRRGRSRFRERDRRAHKYKKFKQVFHAILGDEANSSQMPPEAFAETDSGEHPPGTSPSSSSDEATVEEGEEGDDDFMPAEVFAQEYKAKQRVNAGTREDEGLGPGAAET